MDSVSRSSATTQFSKRPCGPNNLSPERKANPAHSESPNPMEIPGQGVTTPPTHLNTHYQHVPPRLYKSQLNPLVDEGIATPPTHLKPHDPVPRHLYRQKLTTVLEDEDEWSPPPSPPPRPSPKEDPRHRLSASPRHQQGVAITNPPSAHQPTATEWWQAPTTITPSHLAPPPQRHSDLSAIIEHAIQSTATIKEQIRAVETPTHPALLSDISKRYIPDLNQWLVQISTSSQTGLAHGLPGPVHDLIAEVTKWVTGVSTHLTQQLMYPQRAFIEQDYLDILHQWVDFQQVCHTLKIHGCWRPHLDTLHNSQDNLRKALIAVMKGDRPTQWLHSLTQDNLDVDAPITHECFAQMKTHFPDHIPDTLSASADALSLLLSLRRHEWPVSTAVSCLTGGQSGIRALLKAPIYPSLRVWIVTESHAVAPPHVKRFPLILATFQGHKQYQTSEAHQPEPHLTHLYTHPKWACMVDTCHQQGQLKALKMAYRAQRPNTPYDIAWLKGYDAILRHYPSKPSRHTDEIDAWIASGTRLETLTSRKRPPNDKVTDRLHERFEHHTQQGTPLAHPTIQQALLAHQWTWLSTWAATTPQASHGIDTLMTAHHDCAISWLVANGQSQLSVWQTNRWISDLLWDHLLQHDSCRLIIWQWAGKAQPDDLPPLVLASRRHHQFPEQGWESLISTNQLSWPSLLRLSLGTDRTHWEGWGEVFPNDVIRHCPDLAIAQRVFETQLHKTPLVIDDTINTHGVDTLKQWLGDNQDHWQQWLTHCHHDAITHCGHPAIITSWLSQAIDHQKINHIATILQHQSQKIDNDTLTSKAYLTWFAHQASDAITHCHSSTLLSHLLSQAIANKDGTSIKALLGKNLDPDDIKKAWQNWVSIDQQEAIKTCLQASHMAIIIRHCSTCQDMPLDKKRQAFEQIIARKLPEQLCQMAWCQWLHCDPDGAIAASNKHPGIIPLLAQQLQASGNEKGVITLLQTNGKTPNKTDWWPDTSEWVYRCQCRDETRGTVLAWGIQYAPDDATGLYNLASVTPVEMVMTHILNDGLSSGIRGTLFSSCENRLSDQQLATIQAKIPCYNEWIQQNPYQWAKWVQAEPNQANACPKELAHAVFNLLSKSPSFSSLSFSTLCPLIQNIPPAHQGDAIMACAHTIIKDARWPGDACNWAPYLQRHALLAVNNDAFKGLTHAVLTARIQDDPIMGSNTGILRWVGTHHPDHLRKMETAPWYNTTHVNTMIQTLGHQHPHITNWWDRALSEWCIQPEKTQAWVSLYLKAHPTLGDTWLAALMKAPESVNTLLTPGVAQDLWQLPNLLDKPTSLDPLLVGLATQPLVAETMLTALIEKLKTDVKSVTDATMSLKRQTLITYCLSQLEHKTSPAEQRAYNQVCELKQAETFQFKVPVNRMDHHMLACLVGNSVLDDHCTDQTPSPVTLGAWLHEVITAFGQADMHPSFQLNTKAPRQTIQWLQEAAQLTHPDGPLTPQSQWQRLIDMPPNTSHLITLGCLIPSQSAQPRHGFTALIAHRTQMDTWALYHIDPQAPPFIHQAQHTPIKRDGKQLGTITQAIPWTAREIKGPLTQNAPTWWHTLLQTQQATEPLSNWVFYNAIWSQVPGTTMKETHEWVKTLGRGQMTSAFQLFGGMALLATRLYRESPTDYDRLMCLVFLGAAEDVAAQESRHGLFSNPELNAITTELKHELTSRCLKYLQNNPKTDGFSSTLMTHTIRLANALDKKRPLPPKMPMGCQFSVPENQDVMTLFFPYIPIPESSMVIEELPAYRAMPHATLAELKHTIDRIGHGQHDPATQHRMLQGVFHHMMAGLPIPPASASQSERDTLMAQLLGMARFLSDVVKTQKPLMLPSYSMWHPVSWHQLGLSFLTLAQTAWQVVANAPETQSVVANTRIGSWNEWRWVYHVNDPRWVRVATQCQAHENQHQTNQLLFKSIEKLTSRIDQHTITPGHEHYCPMDHGLYAAMKTQHIDDDTIFNDRFKQTQNVMPYLRDMLQILGHYFDFFFADIPPISTLPELNNLLRHRDKSDSAAIVTTHANPPRHIPDMPTTLYLHLTMSQNTKAMTTQHGVTWASRVAAMLASRTLQLEQLSHRIAISSAMRDWWATHPNMGEEANTLANQLAYQATLLTQKGPLCSGGLAWIASTLCQLNQQAQVSLHIKQMAPGHIHAIRQTLLDWTTHPDHPQRAGIVAAHWMLTYQFDQEPSDPALWFSGLLRWRQALSHEKPLYCPLDDTNPSNHEIETQPTDLGQRQQAVIHTCQHIIWQHLDHLNPMAPQHLSAALAHRQIVHPSTPTWQVSPDHPYLWGATDDKDRWHVDTSTGMVYRNGVSIDRLPTDILNHPDYQAIRPSTPHDWQLIDGWFCGQSQGDESAPSYQLALVAHHVACEQTPHHLTLNGEQIPVAKENPRDTQWINSWLHPFQCVWKRYQHPGSPIAWLVEHNPPKNRPSLLLECETQQQEIIRVIQWLPYGQTWIQRTIMSRYEPYFLGSTSLSERGPVTAYFRDVLMPTPHQLIIREKTNGVFIPSWIGDCQLPGWLHDPKGEIWQTDDQLHFKSNRLSIQSIRPYHDRTAQHVKINHQEGRVLPLHDYHDHPDSQKMANFEPYNHTLLLETDTDWQLRFLRLGIKLIKPKNTTQDIPTYCPELGNAQLVQTHHTPIWPGFTDYLCLVDAAQSLTRGIELDKVPFKVIIATRPFYCPPVSYTEPQDIGYYDVTPESPPYVVGHFNPVSRRFDSDTIMGRLVLANVFYLSANLIPCHYTNLNGYEMAALLLGACHPSVPFSKLETDRLHRMLKHPNPHRNACAIRLKIIALLNQNHALHALEGFSDTLMTDNPPVSSDDINRYVKARHRVPVLCQLSETEWARIPIPPTPTPPQTPYQLNQALTAFINHPGKTIEQYWKQHKETIFGHYTHPLCNEEGPLTKPLDTLSVPNVWVSWLREIQTSTRPREDLRIGLWASGSRLTNDADITPWAICMALTHCNDWSPLASFQSLINANQTLYHGFKYPSINRTFHFLSTREHTILEQALNHVAPICHGERAINTPYAPLSEHPLTHVTQWFHQLEPTTKDRVKRQWDEIITNGYKATQWWQLLHTVCNMAITYAKHVSIPPAQAPASITEAAPIIIDQHDTMAPPASVSNTPLLSPDQYVTPIRDAMLEVGQSIERCPAATGQMTDLAQAIQRHCQTVLPALLGSATATTSPETTPFPLMDMKPVATHERLVSEWVNRLRVQWSQLTHTHPPLLPEIPQLIGSLQAIQTTWKTHEERLVSVLETVLCDSVNNPQGWLFQMKQAHGSHPFMLQRVYMGLLNPNALTMINPFIPPEAHQAVIIPMIRVLVSIQTLLQHIKRCHNAINQLAHLRNQGTPNAVLEHTAHTTLYGLLTQEPSPSDDDQTLFELYNNVRIRPIQREMLRWLLPKQQVVTQMNMGEGKSSVILMLMLLQLITKKKKPLVVVPAPLLNDVTQLIKTRLTPLTGVHVMRLPITRETMAQCPENTQEEIKRQLANHDQVPLVLLMTPEETLGLRLALEEAILTGNQSQQAFLRLLHQHSDHVIIDEVDDTLNLTKELNFTWGNRNAIDNQEARVLVPLTLFHEMAMSEGGIPHSLSSEKVDQVLTEHFNIRLPSPWIPAPPQPIHGLSSAMADAIQRWRNPQLYQHVVSLRPQVEYGLCIDNPYDAHLAIPYEGKDTPLIDAIFEHTDVRIGLSILAYYHQGLLFSHWVALIRLAITRPYDAQSWWAQWIEGTDCPIQHWDSVNVSDIRQAKSLHALLGRRPVVIRSYITHIALANITEFENKLSADGTTLTYPSPSKQIVGFSGTTTTALPRTVMFEPLPALAQTDALTLRLFANPTVVTIHDQPVPSNSRDLMNAFIDQCNHDPSVTCILDAGALITGYSNQAVATYLSRGIKREPFHGVVFFGDKGEVLLMRPDSDLPIPFCDTDCKPEHIITYVNDIRTRGTDRVFPPLGRGLLTVGERLANDRLTQAAMRLRQLGRGQTVTLWVSERIKTDIMQWSDQVPLRPVDVYGWSMWQSACRDGEASTLQEIRYDAATAKRWVTDPNQTPNPSTLLSNKRDQPTGPHVGHVHMSQKTRTHIQVMQKALDIHTLQSKGHEPIQEKKWDYTLLTNPNWDKLIGATQATSLGWPAAFKQVLWGPNARDASTAKQGKTRPLIRPIQEYGWGIRSINGKKEPCVLILTGEEAMGIRQAFKDRDTPLHVLQWHDPTWVPPNAYSPPLSLCDHQRLWVLLSIINGECGIHTDRAINWLKTDTRSADAHWESIVSDILHPMTETDRVLFQEKLVQNQAALLKQGFENSPLHRLIRGKALQPVLGGL